MKTIRLFLLSLFLVTMTIAVSNAQKNYNNALGVRMGYWPGITFKHFVSQRGAFEAIVNTRWHGFMFHGLYEIHHKAFNEPGFNFYYGFGGHAGYWRVGRFSHPWYDDRGNYSAFGLDGILGLEYSFSQIPLNLSVDWKPMLNLVDWTGLWVDDVGLSVRIYF
jgi:hypothetical protein